MQPGERNAPEVIHRLLHHPALGGGRHDQVAANAHLGILDQGVELLGQTDIPLPYPGGIDEHQPAVAELIERIGELLGIAHLTHRATHDATIGLQLFVGPIR